MLESTLLSSINKLESKRTIASPKKGKSPAKPAKKSILDANEFDSEREDYELKIKGLKEKIQNIEEKMTLIKNDKDNADFKVIKKKGKIKELKEEIEKLKSKLEQYESKELYEKFKKNRDKYFY